MSLWSLLGISTAYAADTAGAAAQSAQTGSPFSALPFMIGLIAIAYFLLIRPQSRRAKQQRQLLGSVAVGDEILTSGGIIGRVVKLQENYLVVNLGKELEMVFQKNAVAAVLPKGTLSSMQ